MAPKKTDFAVFAKLMAKAVLLGQTHKLDSQTPATPFELVTRLKVPPSDAARGQYVLHLREAYLAGYNFVERK